MNSFNQTPMESLSGWRGDAVRLHKHSLGWFCRAQHGYKALHWPLELNPVTIPISCSHPASAYCPSYGAVLGACHTGFHFTQTLQQPCNQYSHCTGLYCFFQQPTPTHSPPSSLLSSYDRLLFFTCLFPKTLPCPGDSLSLSICSPLFLSSLEVSGPLASLRAHRSLHNTRP